MKNNTWFLINMWLKQKNRVFVNTKQHSWVEFDKADRPWEVPSSLNHSTNPGKKKVTLLQIQTMAISHCENNFQAKNTGKWSTLSTTKYIFSYSLPNISFAHLRDVVQSVQSIHSPVCYIRTTPNYWWKAENTQRGTDLFMENGLQFHHNGKFRKFWILWPM